MTDEEPISVSLYRMADELDAEGDHDLASQIRERARNIESIGMTLYDLAGEAAAIEDEEQP